jgi:hypothetical protein
MNVGQIERVKCPITGEWMVKSEAIADNEPPKPKVKAKVEPAEFIPIKEGPWTIAAVDPVMGKHIIDICDVVPPLPTPVQESPKVKPKNWVSTPVRCHPQARINGPEGKRAHNRPLVPVIHAAEETWKTGERLAELRYKATIVDKETGQTRNGSFEASSMDDVLSTLAGEGWTLVDGPSVRTETLVRGTETITVEYL